MYVDYVSKILFRKSLKAQIYTGCRIINIPCRNQGFAKKGRLAQKIFFVPKMFPLRR